MNKPITDLKSASNLFNTSPELRAQNEQTDALKGIEKILKEILTEIKSLKAAQKSD